jgi:hypothetical protein
MLMHHSASRSTNERPDGTRPGASQPPSTDELRFHGTEESELLDALNGLGRRAAQEPPAHLPPLTVRPSWPR